MPGPPLIQQDQRMRFPDGLRAVAAMLVILPHAIGFFAYWPTPSPFTQFVLRLAPYGASGVHIFFVLSGFVIAYTLRNATLSPRFIGQFFLRRSIRLDPPYWSAILFYLGYIALRRQPFPSAAQLTAHVFYLQDILGYGDINGAFWTLCIEIQFYIAFCLLLWAFQQRRAPFLVLFVLSLGWPSGLITSTIYPGSFLPHWYAFLAGAIICWTVAKQLPEWAGYASVAATWVAAAAKGDWFAFIAGLTAALLLIASYRGNLYRWLNFPPFQLLGELSYCIYLVHVPIAEILLGVIARLAPHHEIVSYLFLALVVAITIPAAYAMHLLIEAPALRWSRRLKLPETQPTAARHRLAG